MGTESRSVPKRKGFSVEAAEKWLAEHYLGLLLVLVVAYASVRLGAAFPLIGAPVFGIVLGMVLRTAVGVPEGCRAGVKWSGKRILQIAIVLLGAGYSLDKIWAAGAESIGLILMVLAIAFVITLGAGRFLGVESNLRHLIAFGTAFCGASAIAAVSPVIAPQGAGHLVRDHDRLPLQSCGRGRFPPDRTRSGSAGTRLRFMGRDEHQRHVLHRGRGLCLRRRGRASGDRGEAFPHPYARAGADHL